MGPHMFCVNFVQIRKKKICSNISSFPEHTPNLGWTHVGPERSLPVACSLPRDITHIAFFVGVQ